MLYNTAYKQGRAARQILNKGVHHMKTAIFDEQAEIEEMAMKHRAEAVELSARWREAEAEGDAEKLACVSEEVGAAKAAQSYELTVWNLYNQLRHGRIGDAMKKMELMLFGTEAEKEAAAAAEEEERAAETAAAQEFVIWG